MKGLSIATTLLATLASTVFSQELRELEKVNVDVVFTSENELPELINGQEIPFEMVVSNGESDTVTIDGFGGEFSENNKKEKHVANLTSTKINSVEIKSGEHAKISHSLRVNLPPTELQLAVQLIGNMNSELVRVNVPKFPVSVNDPAISWFDPKLILAQLILAGTLLAAGWTVTKMYVMPYLEPKKSEKKKKAASNSSTNNNNDDDSSGVQTNGKGYDESWIPEHHLRPTTGKKKKRQ